MGHAGGVRWVAFRPDGTTFLSASFDQNVKLWDTESGKCLGNYSKGTIPFQAVWAPTDPPWPGARGGRARGVRRSAR